MILNGLGLVRSLLYLFSIFFEGKAIEHLIRRGVKSEYFNDDRLGRVLDKLDRTGLNKIFVSIVLEAIKKYELNVETTHLDSTSFCVRGEYETGIISSEKSEEPKLINMTYGYSRERRPDLKQFMMNLICTSDGDVPLWMRIGSGNESDRKQFVGAMMDFRKKLKFDSIMVANSAFYSQENLQKFRNVKWISRVPFKVKAEGRHSNRYRSREI